MFREYSKEENILIYDIEPFEEVDEFSFQMLKANALPCVLTLGRKDDAFLLPITNLVPLNEFLKEYDDREAIINQYKEIEDMILEYMIPKEELILNYEYAFVDKEEARLVLPIIPTSHSFYETHSLLEFRLCCLYANEKPEIKKKEKIKKEKIKKEKKPSISEKLKNNIFKGPRDDIFDFPEEDILPEGISVIAVRSTGEEYPLMFGPDIIGTDPGSCSIAFPNNMDMEKEHCSVTLARGHYYLADLNSKMGTLLNGKAIEPGKTYELRSADLISVAGEELIFSKRN